MAVPQKNRCPRRAAFRGRPTRVPRLCQPCSMRPLFRTADTAVAPNSRLFRQPPASARRAAFTLVELLVVILIISMLVGLLIAAVMPAITTAKNAKVQLEIDQIAAKVSDYQSEHGNYPPSFALTDNGSTPAFEPEALIMRHVAQRWPRFIVDTPPGSGDGDFDYDDLEYLVALVTLPALHDLPAVTLDINGLDQAEALVFWLAGFPSRTIEIRTVGFSLNELNPFEGPGAQLQRTTRSFEFDPSRLVDRDEDGWWEYIPDTTAATGDMPPYVYFDSTSYNASVVAEENLASYPSEITGALRGPANTTLWGVCWPLLREEHPLATTPLGPPNWYNSDKFQIIYCGLDGAYSASGASRVYPPVDAAEMVYPDGPFQEEEMDNLSNMGEGVFADERDKHTH